VSYPLRLERGHVTPQIFLLLTIFSFFSYKKGCLSRKMVTLHKKGFFALKVPYTIIEVTIYEK